MIEFIIKFADGTGIKMCMPKEYVEAVIGDGDRTYLKYRYPGARKNKMVPVEESYAEMTSRLLAEPREAGQ